MPVIASTGCAVQLGVVEAVEQVDAAGPGGREADAEPAGELGVAAGHEGGGLLVAHLDEADLVLALAQGLHDAVDAVAGQAEDDIDAPVVNRVDENVGGSRGHCAIVPSFSRLIRPSGSRGRPVVRAIL